MQNDESSCKESENAVAAVDPVSGLPASNMQKKWFQKIGIQRKCGGGDTKPVQETSEWIELWSYQDWRNWKCCD